jgi:CRP-like cAMP-binding protein
VFWGRVLSWLRSDASVHQRAAHALARARHAADRGDISTSVDQYIEAIQAFHVSGDAPGAAQAARQALEVSPADQRVLRLISRLYAASPERQREESMLLLAAAQEAAGEDGPEWSLREPSDPSATSRLAMFSLFPRDSFERLVVASRMRHFGNGEVLFKPGDLGASIFLVTGGSAQVLDADRDGREHEAARVGPGAVLGVFSYMSGRPRAANVRAIESLDVMEIPAEVLDQECARSDRFATILARFCRDRLLLNMLGSLPGFSDLAYREKAKLLGRFRLRRLEPGEELVAQGAEEGMVGLVVEGQVRALMRRKNLEAEMSLMQTGDAFGTVGSPPGVPADAALVAGGLGCRIALLPPAALAGLWARWPAIADLRPGLRARGALVTEAIFRLPASTPVDLVPSAWRTLR